MNEAEYLAWQLKGSEETVRTNPARLARALAKMKEYGGLPADPATRILSAGCRDGYELYLLDKVHGYRSLVGVDISRKWIASGLILTDYDLRVADAHYLDCVRNGGFQAVVAIHVLEHLRDPYRALLRFRDVLQPKGLLNIVVPVEVPVERPEESSFHVTFFSEIKEVTELCTVSDFSILTQVGLPAEPPCTNSDEFLVIAQKNV